MLSKYSFQALLLILGLCAVHVMPAQAQSQRELENRLSRLENELQTLNRAIYRGESVPPPRTFDSDVNVNADTTIRIQQLEEELRRLTGQLEEQEFARRQLEQKLERVMNDVELRLRDVEGGGAAPASGAAQPAQPLPGSAGAASNSPASGNTAGTLGTLRQPAESQQTGAVAADPDDAAAVYENAFALLKSAQYEQAERAFDQFISAYPDHVLVGNAQYWLGETYYVRGEYERAARIFAEGYQQFPEGSKAPDNLLKLGMSLAGLGNTEDACVALGQIENDYPQGAGPVLRRARQEMSRLGC